LSLIIEIFGDRSSGTIIFSLTEPDGRNALFRKT